MSRFKHQMLDKYEAHIPNKAHWVHGEYYVSTESERFHLSYGWLDNGVSAGRRRSGTRFGIQKKLYHATSCGIQVDSAYVGKSENT